MSPNGIIYISSFKVKTEVTLSFEVKKERGVTLQVQKVLKCGIITLNEKFVPKKTF